MGRRKSAAIAQEAPYNYPLYYYAEVARLADISIYRVHRWLKGYEYSYESRRIKQPPIFKKRERLSEGSSYASFYDLIDLLFVKRFLDRGISLQKIRKALKEAEEVLGASHFAHQVFFTDDRNIFLKIKERGGAIIELLSCGQWAIRPFIEELGHLIEFDDITKSVCRWYPPEGDRLVVLDPWVSFGRPIIVQKGITTESIYDLYLAEGRNEFTVANWMDLESQELKAAVKFEEYLAE